MRLCQTDVCQRVEDVPGTRGCHDHFRVRLKDFLEKVDQAVECNPLAASDVKDASADVFRLHSEQVRLHHVINKREVARLLAVTMHGDRRTVEQTADELWNHR